MERKDFENYAEKLKALGHPVRLKIAIELAVSPLSVSTLCLCLEIPQATVSQHLSILRNKGIITGERKGTSVSYSLHSEPIRDMLEQLRISVGDLPASAKVEMSEARA